MITAIYAFTLWTVFVSLPVVQRQPTVSGHVRVSGRQEAVPFAIVRLIQFGQAIDQQVTMNDGGFEFRNVEPDMYTVEVTHPGFQTVSVQVQVLGRNGPGQLDIELKAPGSSP